MRYVCELCGLVYDEANGYPTRKIAPGTRMEDLPVDFSCPSCGSEKEAFCAVVPKQHPSDRQGCSFQKYTKYMDVPAQSDR